MKKVLTLTLLLLTSTLSEAQIRPAKGTQSIGVFISPTITSFGDPCFLLDDDGTLNGAATSYQMGINFTYKYNENTDAVLAISNTKFRTVSQVQEFNFRNDKYASPKDYKNYYTDYNIEYIDITLGIKADFELDNLYMYFSPFIEGNFFNGATNNINYTLLSGYEGTYTNDNMEFMNLNYNKLALTAGGSIGVGIPFSKNWNINTEFRFKHMVTSIAKTDEHPLYGYSFGLVTGINYYF